MKSPLLISIDKTFKIHDLYAKPQSGNKIFADLTATKSRSLDNLITENALTHH